MSDEQQSTIERLQAQVAALELRTEKLDRLVYKLYQRAKAEDLPKPQQ